jgi:NAD(P)-dependent dehydrogenase (short-subunit alcohol dehydrogenase family)
MTTSSMDGKTVLITGGNAGLGLETAVALAAMGASVVITSRSADKGEAARKEIIDRSGSAHVEVMELDLASFTSIRACAEAFLASHPRLDVLVNNAGLILSERTETEEGFETTFGVNHLGHFLLTDLLLDRIKASAPARIVNVASEAHKFAIDGLKWDDLQTEGFFWSYRVYGRSKLANIYFTRSLAKRLDGTGVTVNAVHPGTVATQFARDGDTSAVTNFTTWVARPFSRTAEEGARTQVWAASAPELEGVTGEYLMNNRIRTKTLSPVARRDEPAERLWTVSEELVASTLGAS